MRFGKYVKLSNPTNTKHTEAEINNQQAHIISALSGYPGSVLYNTTVENGVVNMASNYSIVKDNFIKDVGDKPAIIIQGKPKKRATAGKLLSQVVIAVLAYNATHLILKRVDK